jgi:hypothetical protein
VHAVDFLAGGMILLGVAAPNWPALAPMIGLTNFTDVFRTPSADAVCRSARVSTRIPDGVAR